MSAFDKILESVGLKLEYEDEIEEEETEGTAERPKAKEQSVKETPKKSFRSERTSIPLQSALADPSHPLVILLRPTKIADAQHICDELKAGKTVVVNVEELSKEEIVRLYDFVSGVRYALEAKTMDITENVFVVAPSNVEIKLGETKEEASDEYLDEDVFDNDEDF